MWLTFLKEVQVSIWYNFQNFVEKEIVKYLRNVSMEEINRGWKIQNLNYIGYNIKSILSYVKVSTGQNWTFSFQNSVCLVLTTRQQNVPTSWPPSCSVWLLWHDLWWCAGLACNNLSVYSIHFFLTPCWATLCWQRETDHRESISTMKVGTRYKSGVPPFQLVCVYWHPATLSPMFQGWMAEASQIFTGAQANFGSLMLCSANNHASASTLPTLAGYYQKTTKWNKMYQEN